MDEYGDLRASGGQAEAYHSRSLRMEGEKSLLPAGGGPYKGFAFVVLSDKDDFERLLRRWKWNKGVQLEEMEMEVDAEVNADQIGLRSLSL